MLIAVIPLVILLLGLVGYILSSNPKAAECGRILFFCGAFVLTWTMARVTLHLP